MALWARYVAVLLIVAPLAAQVPKPLTERIEVNVVNVDVTVLDHGKPVRGLTAADFEIFEDGKPQQITNFYAVDRSRQGTAASTSGVGSAAPVAIANLEKHISDRLDAECDWSIATIDRQPRLVLPLTADRTKIHLALEAIRKQGPRKISMCRCSNWSSAW